MQIPLFIVNACEVASCELAVALLAMGTLVQNKSGGMFQNLPWIECEAIRALLLNSMCIRVLDRISPSITVSCTVVEVDNDVGMNTELRMSGKNMLKFFGIGGDTKRLDGILQEGIGSGREEFGYGKSKTIFEARPVGDVRIRMRWELRTHATTHLWMVSRVGIVLS
jgi:hypothetical protein